MTAKRRISIKRGEVFDLEIVDPDGTADVLEGASVFDDTAGASGSRVEIRGQRWTYPDEERLWCSCGGGKVQHIGSADSPSYACLSCGRVQQTPFGRKRRDGQCLCGPRYTARFDDPSGSCRTCGGFPPPPPRRPNVGPFGSPSRGSPFGGGSNAAQDFINSIFRDVANMGTGPIYGADFDPRRAADFFGHASPEDFARSVGGAYARRGTPEPSWRERLGFSTTESPNEREVTARYRERMKTAHPDRGGSNEAAVELNRAYEQARREVGRR